MLIDTNVYSALDRGVQAAADVIKSQEAIRLPFCVVAELYFGFSLGAKRNENTYNLERFISQEQVDMVFPAVRTVEIYGELASYCRKRGRALSNNDLWIAALAMEHNIRLVTYDQDFTVLSDRMGDKLVLLED